MPKKEVIHETLSTEEGLQYMRPTLRGRSGLIGVEGKTRGGTSLSASGVPKGFLRPYWLPTNRMIAVAVMPC